MNDVFYKKIINCPLCGSCFDTMKVRKSKLHLIKMDTDFFKYFEDENPYFYEINVCPECGFAFSDNLEEKPSESQVRSFKESISRQWGRKQYNGVRDIRQALDTYKLALISAEAIKLKTGIIAGILLRISWLYRLLDNTTEEQKYMLGSVRFFKEAYEHDELGDSTNPEIIVYMLGELNYRTGNPSEAIKWFNYGITKYCSDPSAKKQIIKMIRNRWMDIRQEMKRA